MADITSGNSSGNSNSHPQLGECSNSRPTLNVNDIDPELRVKLEDRQQGVMQQTFPIVLNIQPSSPMATNIVSTPIPPPQKPEIPSSSNERETERQQQQQKVIASLQREPQQPSPASASVSLRSPLNSPKGLVMQQQQGQVIGDSNNGSPAMDDIDVEMGVQEVNKGGEGEEEEKEFAIQNDNNNDNECKQERSKGYSLQLNEEGATINEEPPCPKIGELPPAEDLDDDDDDDDDDIMNNINNININNNVNNLINNNIINNNNFNNNDESNDADTEDASNGFKMQKSLKTELESHKSNQQSNHNQNSHQRRSVPQSPRKESRKRAMASGGSDSRQRSPMPRLKRKKVEFTEKNDRDILEGLRNNKTSAQIIREYKLPFNALEVDRRIKKLTRTKQGEDHISSMSSSSGIEMSCTDKSSSIPMFTNNNNTNNINTINISNNINNSSNIINEDSMGKELSSSKKVVAGSNASSIPTITHFFPIKSESNQISKMEEAFREKEKEYESRIAELERFKEEHQKRYEEEVVQKDKFIVNINLLI